MLDKSSFTKFRKKPVVIEAVQWTGTNTFLITEFMFGKCEKYTIIPSQGLDEDGIVLIGTLEGTMTAIVGDWIIKGVNGEFYPCKPDIFEKSYEEVV